MKQKVIINSNVNSETKNVRRNLMNFDVAVVGRLLIFDVINAVWFMFVQCLHFLSSLPSKLLEPVQVFAYSFRPPFLDISFNWFTKSNKKKPFIGCTLRNSVDFALNENIEKRSNSIPNSLTGIQTMFACVHGGRASEKPELRHTDFLHHHHRDCSCLCYNKVDTLARSHSLMGTDSMWAAWLAGCEWQRGDLNWFYF